MKNELRWLFGYHDWKVIPGECIGIFHCQKCHQTVEASGSVLRDLL